jgi:hypothetical protein
MDVRRYELATLAAARWLHSSYSCLAHGAVLLELDEPVCEIALDHRTAGLDDVDVAVMDLARTLDALEARPDASYGELAPELRELLIIGRPIAGPYPGRDRARLALDRSEA